MCGIVGYIGDKNAVKAVIHGLHKLEYRGYDSVGIGVIEKNKVKIYKDKGRVKTLDNIVPKNLNTSLAIGHTRWATHGKPSKLNAHPQSDCKNEIAIVHNGIIENFGELKQILKKEGHNFKSETDSEVLAHLIEKFYGETKDLAKAVKITLDKINGTYGIVVISSKEPDKMIVARSSSPIIIGVGKGENFVASDATAVIKYTKKIIYIDDGEMAIVTKDNIDIFNKDNIRIDKKIESLNWSAKEVEKNGYPTFMLKEIYEQPKSFTNTLAGHIDLENGTSHLGGMQNLFPDNEIHNIKRIVIIGCGTSWHAGLMGEYYFENMTGLPTEVEYASEFRYRNPAIDSETFVIGISQSGETADTLAALREAKGKGAKVFGIVNVVGSTISREVDEGLYIHVGPEIGVASTKAFLSQVLALFLVSLYIGRKKRLSIEDGIKFGKQLQKIPSIIDEVLQSTQAQIKKIADKYCKYTNFLYLGRGFNFPVALEGALKLKEISYVHAEGYPAGEMKHGPIALIDKDFPTFFIAPNDNFFQKSISNIQEIKARNGKLILLTDDNAKVDEGLVDDIIRIPTIDEEFYPFIETIPVQLFAYYIAIKKNRDVDKPRNLAKSVTVE
ncbi:glutamine--fructose-6-phosphate transaminase (isomerizing) [bacterium]|nr:glutamine--fructose-6-phosphate transaminase (isomerizing) [bacterium]